MPPLRTAAIAAVAALAFAGCGAQSDDEKIRAAVTDYYKAFAAGDGEKACAQLSDKARDQFTLRSRAPGCPAAVARAVERPDVKKFRNRLGDVSIQGVDVNGRTATADVSAIGSKTKVPLVRDGETWKIDSEGDDPVAR